MTLPDDLILNAADDALVLVAPSKLAPDGFVNVQTGQTHKVVW